MHNMINVESHNCVSLLQSFELASRLLCVLHCSSHTAPHTFPSTFLSDTPYIPDSAFFLRRSSYIALAFLIQHYSYTVPPALLLHY